MYTKNYTALEFDGSNLLRKMHTVAVEKTIELFVNGILVASILATPEMLKSSGSDNLFEKALHRNLFLVPSDNIVSWICASAKRIARFAHHARIAVRPSSM